MANLHHALAKVGVRALEPAEPKSPMQARVANASRDGKGILTPMSTLADQAFLLMLITTCLGACIVRAFWEIEQSRERRRQQSRNAAMPTRRR
jgi:hypothetical protein